MAKKLTTSEFIKKTLKEIGIELTVVGTYKNMNTPMLFRNKYGIVKKSLTELKRGKGISIKSATNKSSYIVNMFKEVHKDKYNYSLVDYKSSHSNIKIICPEHGVFDKQPYSHLKGFGCKKCYVEGLQSNTADFIKKSKLIHGEKYDYSLVNYKSSKEKVKIICKEHGVFEQIASSHLEGCGCPKCADSGFKINKPAILYYLKYKDLYKIGITNRSVGERYTVAELKYVTLLKEVYFENGEDALKEETRIKRENKEFLYNKFNNLTKSISSEMYMKNIINKTTENGKL